MGYPTVVDGTVGLPPCGEAGVEGQVCVIGRQWRVKSWDQLCSPGMEGRRLGCRMRVPRD